MMVWNLQSIMAVGQTMATKKFGAAGPSFFLHTVQYSMYQYVFPNITYTYTVSVSTCIRTVRCSRSGRGRYFCKQLKAAGKKSAEGGAEGGGHARLAPMESLQTKGMRKQLRTPPSPGCRRRIKRGRQQSVLIFECHQQQVQ
jgi:hypothetical protein